MPPVVPHHLMMNIQLFLYYGITLLLLKANKVHRTLAGDTSQPLAIEANHITAGHENLLIQVIDMPSKQLRNYVCTFALANNSYHLWWVGVVSIFFSTINCTTLKIYLSLRLKIATNILKVKKGKRLNLPCPLILPMELYFGRQIQYIKSFLFFNNIGAVQIKVFGW